MTRTKAFMNWIRMGNRVLVALAFLVGVVLLLLLLAGKFSRKVPTTPVTQPLSAELAKGNVETEVRVVSLPTFEPAIGEVQTKQKTTIRSQLEARVKEINVMADQKVHAGEVLVRLDDDALQEQLRGARSKIAEIEPLLKQLIDDEKRYKNLVEKNAISIQKYNQTVANLTSTRANLQGTKAAYDRLLKKMVIRSPVDGTVIDKKVNVGDSVVPKQVLVELYNPHQMQLVANVREALKKWIQDGQDIGVRIDALDKTCVGTISEVVPEVDPQSRTFEVKVTGPCPPNVYSGMSGKIIVPTGYENMMIIPQRAIRYVGQLELVKVVRGDRVEQRYIRTGRSFSAKVTGGRFGDEIEVLSGLHAGEKILVLNSDQTTREAAHD